MPELAANEDHPATFQGTGSGAPGDDGRQDEPRRQGVASPGEAHPAETAPGDGSGLIFQEIDSGTS